ncbi:MAG: hypothetical protein K0S51_831 [Bacillales bacterium]|jgi:hypothetical protein|nr:hypothetical protein [Bacillales bacterium]
MNVGKNLTKFINIEEVYFMDQNFQNQFQMVDPSMLNAVRRPIYYKRPRPRPRPYGYGGYGLGGPFLGGVVGGLLGSVLLGGTGYGGYGYGYPVYTYPPYYPYGGGLYY